MVISNILLLEAVVNYYTSLNSLPHQDFRRQPYNLPRETQNTQARGDTIDIWTIDGSLRSPLAEHLLTSKTPFETHSKHVLTEEGQEVSLTNGFLGVRNAEHVGSLPEIYGTIQNRSIEAVMLTGRRFDEVVDVGDFNTPGIYWNGLSTGTHSPE
ncbi:hypothetical protein J6590_058309 [Homalodisca vitripennis]|nr:hypothetical protein J6590_058309 [Homalodisca vitripennis]